MMKKNCIILAVVGLTTISGTGLAFAADRGFSDQTFLVPSLVTPVASIETYLDETNSDLFGTKSDFNENDASGDDGSFLDLGVYFDELSVLAPDVSIFPVPRPDVQSPAPVAAPVIVVAPAPVIPRNVTIAPAPSTVARSQQMMPALVIGVYR